MCEFDTPSSEDLEVPANKHKNMLKALPGNWPSAFHCLIYVCYEYIYFLLKTPVALHISNMFS